MSGLFTFRINVNRFQMSFATLDFIRHVLTFHDTFVIQYLGKQDIHDKQEIINKIIFFMCILFYNFYNNTGQHKLPLHCSSSYLEVSCHFEKSEKTHETRVHLYSHLVISFHYNQSSHPIISQFSINPHDQISVFIHDGPEIN